MPIIKASGSQSGLWSQLQDEGVLQGISKSNELDDPGDESTLLGADGRRQRAWSWDTLQLEQDFGRHVVAATGITVGFPKGKIFSGARTLLTDTNPGGTLNAKAFALTSQVDIPDFSFADMFCNRKGILGDAMESSFGPALDAIGNISGLARDLVPIVGAVANALVLAIKFFAGLNQDEQPPEFSYKLARFSPQDDRIFANEHLLNTVKSSRDWTRIWSPPGLGMKTVQYEPDFFVTTVKDNGGNDWGFRIEPADGENKVGGDLWTGGIPLQGNIDLGWEISKYGTAASGTRSLGALLPTGRNQLPKLWSMALNPGSAASFCVDVSALRSRWSGYLMGLRRTILTSDEIPDAARAAFINGEGVKYFGWAPHDPSYEFEGKSADVVAPKWGIGPSGDPDKPSLFDEIDRLEKVQRASVDTVACAYAMGSFSGLGPGSPFRSRWHDNRLALLQHSAVCKVDLDSIPDLEYRNAVHSAQTARVCVGGGLKLSAGPFIHNAPSAPAPAPGLNGLISATRTGGGGGSGALLIAAAMMGFLVLRNR